LLFSVVSGAILDNYPGLTGYRILFAGASIIVGIGVVAGWLLMRNRAERGRRLNNNI